MKLGNMEFAQRLLSNLFPSRCILCNQTVGSPPVNDAVELCADCYSAQPFNITCCSHCALPLAEGISGKVLCGRCIQKLPDYDYAHSLFRYEDDIIGMVHQLKFSEKITYARSIGEMFLSAVSSEVIFKGEVPDCLLPVPLHSSRLRKRGFNQSIEIARVLSKKKDIPIEHKAVVRMRSTPPQTGLDAKQRSKNVKGAFTLVNKIQGK
ncbi:MAG: ComF family protein, partial [Proteobacteria bacterium]|nr:ComF family protein [Pseudomonadota bacterium]